MSKTILIVDDSPSVRQVVEFTLTDAGYTVISADDGLTGLEQLDGKKIHLIVSDVNMPNMDGLTFAEHVKQKEDYAYTPILMLTTESGGDMKARGKAIGVKAWLVKPFKPNLLLSAVSKLA
ncbi:response regulator [Alteromonas sp. A079]|uniref:response regulator n=1 Tax=Alteromonas sp. A079 TaxID=3410268 RepID=UPI003BA27386